MLNDFLILEAIYLLFNLFNFVLFITIIMITLTKKTSFLFKHDF